MSLPNPNPINIKPWSHHFFESSPAYLEARISPTNPILFIPTIILCCSNYLVILVFYQPLTLGDH